MSVTPGLHAGRYGRIARAVIGVWLLLAGTSLLGRHSMRLDTLRPPDSGAGTDAGWALLYLGVLAAVYVLLVLALGERVLVRLNPWSRAALLLTPVLAAVVAGILHLAPGPLMTGTFWYVGVSLLAVAMAGYGGCEVAGLPLLVLRRRYPVYCALNALDVAEAPLTAPQGRVARSTGLLALATGGYFLLGQALLNFAGVSRGFDDRWLALLLLPAAVLLIRRRTRTALRAAMALGLTMVAILVTGSVWVLYLAGTAAILVAGAAAGIRQAVAARTGSSRRTPRRRPV